MGQFSNLGATFLAVRESILSNVCLRLTSSPLPLCLLTSFPLLPPHPPSLSDSSAHLEVQADSLLQRGHYGVDATLQRVAGRKGRCVWCAIEIPHGKSLSYCGNTDKLLVLTYFCARHISQRSAARRWILSSNKAWRAPGFIFVAKEEADVEQTSIKCKLCKTTEIKKRSVILN